MDVERTAVLLAAGGERVIAWETGVAAGLADAGFDSRRAAVLAGTSAGSLVAARLALGVDPREDVEMLGRARGVWAHAAAQRRVAEAMRIWTGSRGMPIGERRRIVGEFALQAATGDEEGYVRAVGELLPPGEWPSSLRLAATDAHSGARVLLDRTRGASVARGVAAARAIPGVRPPVSLDGYALIDGALGSATNADLLGQSADSIVVVTAAAEQAEPGTLDVEFERGLDAERAVLERDGVRVAVVRAGAEERDAMGDDLFGSARPAEAAAAGRRHAQRVAMNWTASAVMD